MGTTHFRSDIQGLAGTEAIAAFASVNAGTVTATTLVLGTGITGNATVTGNVSAAKVKATNYIQIGSRYIFAGGVTETSASIVASASTLVTTASLQGSLYLNTANLWYFTATMTAATVTW